MAKARENKRGKRFALRSLFERALGPRSTELCTSVATADSNWKDADHEQSPPKEQAVFDPWEPISQVTQSAKPALAGSDAGASLPSGDTRSMSSTSTPEYKEEPSGEVELSPELLAGDCDPAELSPDQIAEDLPFYYESTNGAEGKYLEETEEDLSEACLSG